MVDDHFTMGGTPAPDVLKEPVGDAPVEGDEDEAGPESATERPEQPLDAKVLTDAFAKKGLVCGVMKPDEVEPSAATVVAAASRADIVLLDWRLADLGERALEIVQKLAEHEGLRLLAIYTSAGSLDEIAAQVAAHLNDVTPGSDHRYVHEEGRFRVTGHHLTVEVYAKDGSLGTEEERARQIPAEGIPDRLIGDFVAMTRGIVPSAAIATIGALRVETPRVLGLLGARLDAGYLGHRILLPDPEESGDQLIDLIGSELKSVIEDNELVRKAVGQEVIDRYVDRLAPGSLPGEALKTALQIGVSSKGAKDELGKFKEVQDADPKLISGARSRTAHFTNGDAEQALEADRRFAIKLSLRTPSGVPPRLGLGTVIRSDGDEYLISLQPECDAVRLDEPRAFPLLPLKSAKEFKGQELLVGEAEQALGFAIIRHPYELRMLRFTPDPATRAVTAKSEAAGDFVFTADDGRVWHFVAQLRPAHSRDLAHKLASMIGRVGVDQSEVQRLWGDKR